MISKDEKNIDEITAVADAWASIDGRLEEFRGGKDAKTLDEEIDKFGGHYSGYMEDAKELIKRIEKRGFTITSL